LIVPELARCTHEEKGEVEVGEGSPCEDELYSVVDELQLAKGRCQGLDVGRKGTGIPEE
jgi:hypothetical protein